MRARPTKFTLLKRWKWLLLMGLVSTVFVFLATTEVTAPVTLVQKDVPRERLVQTP